MLLATLHRLASGTNADVTIAKLTAFDLLATHGTI